MEDWSGEWKGRSGGGKRRITDLHGLALLQYPALTYWFFVNSLIYTFMAVALG